jgi:hypothetical protein
MRELVRWLAMRARAFEGGSTVGRRRREEGGGRREGRRDDGGGRPWRRRRWQRRREEERRKEREGRGERGDQTKKRLIEEVQVERDTRAAPAALMIQYGVRVNEQVRAVVRGVRLVMCVCTRR